MAKHEGGKSKGADRKPRPESISRPTAKAERALAKVDRAIATAREEEARRARQHAKAVVKVAELTARRADLAASQVPAVVRKAQPPAAGRALRRPARWAADRFVPRPRPRPR